MVQPQGVELNEEEKSKSENMLKQVWVSYINDELDLANLIHTEA